MKEFDASKDSMHNDKDQQNNTVNISERDPNNLQEGLRSVLVFSDVIGEPEPGVFSFDQVWTYSYQVFTVTKLWCYRILSAVCGLPCAIWWGITFAFLSFCNIWCFVPYVKCCQIQFHCIQQVVEMLVKALLVPIFDAVSRCFSGIRITTINHQAADSTPKLDTIHLA